MQIMRTILAFGLKERYRAGIEERNAHKRALIANLRHSPIAIQTDAPKQQHYGVPAKFFPLVLGKRLKYSCCYWPEGVRMLEEAEEPGRPCCS
jgi:cyclopropane-fatty-acyl-phospholipid synthase